MFENTWHYHNEHKQPTWLLLALTALLFRPFNSLSLFVDRLKCMLLLTLVWPLALSNLFGRSLFFFCLSFLSLPFLCDKFASFSHLAMWKTPVMCSECRSECAQVGRCVGRQAGSSSNHFIWSGWNDWTSLLQSCDSHRYWTFFFILSEHLIYWLLSGCKENFNKYYKKCFKKTLPTQALSGCNS